MKKTTGVLISLIISTLIVFGNALAATPLIDNVFHITDKHNKPVPGGLVYTYEPGTTTPKVTYSDEAGTVPHPNPVPLDSEGKAMIYGNGAYTIDVKDMFGGAVNGWPKVVDVYARESELSEIEDDVLSKVTRINTISDLRGYTPYIGEVVNVTGYYSNGDGGGGVFFWDETNTEPDNNGTIIKVSSITTGRWIRSITGYIYAEMFGAKGDDNTFDNQPAIIDALKVFDDIHFQGKRYRIDTPIRIDEATIGKPPFNISLSGVRNKTQLHGYGAINIIELGDGTSPVIAGSVNDIEFLAGDTTLTRAIYGRNVREFDFNNITFTGVGDTARSFTSSAMELIFSWRVNIYNAYGLYLAGDGLVLGNGTGGTESNAISVYGGKINRCDGRGYVSYGAGHTYSGVSCEAAKGGGFVGLYCPGLLISGGYWEENGELSGDTIKITNSQNGGQITGVYIAAGAANHNMILLATVNGFTISGNNFTNLATTGNGVFTGNSVSGVILIGNINESGTGTTYGGTSYPGSVVFQSGSSGVDAVSLAIGYGERITKHISVTSSLSPGIMLSVPGYIDLAISVPGAIIGDTVTVGGPVFQPNFIYEAYVAGPDQVNIRWLQFAGAPTTPTPGTYRVDVWRH